MKKSTKNDIIAMAKVVLGCVVEAAGVYAEYVAVDATQASAKKFGFFGKLGQMGIAYLVGYPIINKGLEIAQEGVNQYGEVDDEPEKAEEKKFADQAKKDLDDINYKSIFSDDDPEFVFAK